MAYVTTIFISAYRNVSVRYILYSDIFKVLRKKDIRIVLFLKDNDIDYYRNRLGAENIVFEPIHYDQMLRLLKSNPIGRLFILIRKCMSGRVPGYENTTDRVLFYQYGKQLSQSIRGFFEFQFVKLIAQAGSKIRFFRKVVVYFEGLLFPGKMYDKYFRKYNPKVLIVSSIGYMIDPYFMRAAKRHGCKVVSIVHNWDNPTTKDYRGTEPDTVIAWNDIMKRELNIFHDIPREKIYVGGIAHWDFYFNGNFEPRSREGFVKPYNLDHDRKILFYGTSGFVLFRNTFDVIETLLEAIKKEKFIYPTQLLVRLHPSYLLKKRGSESQFVDFFKKRIKAIEKRYGDLVSFNVPMMRVLNDDIDMPMEDMSNLAKILYYADVLLTEYSTLMIEAAIFDLPVINVGLYNFRDTEKPASYWENYTHINRLLKIGASKNAYTFEELFKYIDYYLLDRSRDSEERTKLVEQEVTTNRGCAGRKIGEYIWKLLQ